MVKLHTQYGKGIWLLSELDPETEIAYGICDLGDGKPELSYVSLIHLDSLHHARLKVAVLEVDTAFDGKYLMSIYLKAAISNGRITEEESILHRYI